MFQFVITAILLLWLAVPGAVSEGGDCADRSLSAKAVHSTNHVQAFVRCAAEYVRMHGTAEARRAFNEDDRWKHGPTYVFVDQVLPSGEEALSYVFPPDPAREGQVWGSSLDAFGTDYYFELHRLLGVVDAGWIYYAFTNPATGGWQPKSSYVIEIDWDGDRAAIGAGVYSASVPGTCEPGDVNAASLAADPSPRGLEDFVRCAAILVESKGYAAVSDLESDPRWRNGSSYVYVIDMMGNQVATSSQIRVNGQAPHEWGVRNFRVDQFGGRDMAGVGSAFGEAFIYYMGSDPRTGATEPRVGLLKRVVAQGVPLLVGASYRATSERRRPNTLCADDYVTARAVRTRDDVQAFVRCAAEYAAIYGPEEARRAFNEDERWKSGPTYVFVDQVRPSGEEALSYVFPPDPVREDNVWGTSIDSFGSDYYFELHRLLSVVDSGWIYYAFTNPATGLWEPKSSYVIEMDWGGDRAAIGAGVYAPDLPGTCEPGTVNSASLEASPSDEAVRQFVRCAALEVQAKGYFAGPVLSTDPRWVSGSIYVFGTRIEDDETLFSANPFAAGFLNRTSDLFGGRDAVAMTSTFGEAYWYYTFPNPITGVPGPKVSFVKVVRSHDGPRRVGAGYHLPGDGGSD